MNKPLHPEIGTAWLVLSHGTFIASSIGSSSLGTGFIALFDGTPYKEKVKPLGIGWISISILISCWTLYGEFVSCISLIQSHICNLEDCKIHQRKRASFQWIWIWVFDFCYSLRYGYFNLEFSCDMYFVVSTERIKEISSEKSSAELHKSKWKPKSFFSFANTANMSNQPQIYEFETPITNESIFFVKCFPIVQLGSVDEVVISVYGVLRKKSDPERVFIQKDYTEAMIARGKDGIKQPDGRFVFPFLALKWIPEEERSHSEFCFVYNMYKSDDTFLGHRRCDVTFCIVKKGETPNITLFEDQNQEEKN